MLERSADVDVFSFISGSGPVHLAVNPLIVPSGTLGGNLDLVMELYDDVGTILQANNDAMRTAAVIDTTLLQGRYYLHDLSATGGSLDPGQSVAVTVSINTNAVTLPAATYNATLSFTNTSNGTGDTTRSLDLTVTAPGELVVQTTGDLVASGTIGGPFNPGSIIYNLTNPGGTAINWTATKTASWLDLRPSGGSLDPGQSVAVSVSLSTNADVLPAASYNDMVTITNSTNGSGDATRSVILTIVRPGELVVESTGDLVASGAVGGPFTPESVIYTLTNPGGTAIDWTAAKTASWLDLSASSGSLSAGESITLTASLNTGARALVANTYTDTIDFGFTYGVSGTAGRSASTLVPTTRAVILQILADLQAMGRRNPETGFFEVVIQGVAGVRIQLEGTTDFSRWTSIDSGQISADGTLTLSDPESAVLPTRFYRASTSPP